jgi:integrase
VAGLTKKNIERLRPFNAPDLRSKLEHLPDRLLADAYRLKVKAPVRAAWLAQKALAIQIELELPLRLENLASLNITKHFKFGDDGYFVHFDAAEMKGGSDFIATISVRTVAMIRAFLTDFRPILSRVSTYLFVGKDHKPVIANFFAKQICTVLRQHLGVAINIHLFRHLAAKFYLDRRPGDYVTVQHLLCHKSLETTLNFYAEVSSVAQTRLYQAELERARSNYATGQSHVI